MDIGNQQRVIIVEAEPEEHRVPEVEPAQLIDTATEARSEVGLQAAWPLPLDLDRVPAS